MSPNSEQTGNTLHFKAVNKHKLTTQKLRKQIGTCCHLCFTHSECKHCFTPSGSSGAGVKRAGLRVPPHRGACRGWQLPSASSASPTGGGKWTVLFNECKWWRVLPLFPNLGQDFFILHISISPSRLFLLACLAVWHQDLGPNLCQENSQQY